MNEPHAPSLPPILTEKLMDPAFFKENGTEAREASERLPKLEASLEASFTKWSELSEKIEELENA